MQTTPPLRHYQLADVTAQPPVIVDDYQSAECLVSDVWTALGIVFCQPPNAPPPSSFIAFETPRACPLLSGVYAGIDWGANQWACQNFRWFGLPANNIAFSSYVQQRSFAFVDPHVLLSVAVSSGIAGHLTLSSDAGERLEIDLPKGGPITLHTGWQKPAKTITVDFTGRWLLGIGILEYR